MAGFHSLLKSQRQAVETGNWLRQLQFVATAATSNSMSPTIMHVFALFVDL